MMWWNWGSSWFTMWLMMAFSFGGVALLILLALRTDYAPRRRPAEAKNADARQVLALRLARGEIDSTEYLDRINALSEVHDA